MILHDECTVEEMKQCVESAKRKETLEQSERSFDSKALLLSGSNVLRKTIGESGKGNVDKGFSSEIRNSLIIGERCDIASIAKFREIILKIAELNDEICKDIGDEKPVLTPEARTPEKKANLCIEMFKLLVENVGFHPNEVILDPVVTRTPINSQPGANEFGETFFEAISLIRTCSDLRGYNVRLIGGITAVSQFYRGYSKTRIDLNRSFLKHCLEAGMHHVIMEVTNVAHEIKQNLVEDLVTNKDPEAKQKLKAFCCAENYENEDQ